MHTGSLMMWAFDKMVSLEIRGILKIDMRLSANDQAQDKEDLLQFHGS